MQTFKYTHVAIELQIKKPPVGLNDRQAVFSPSPDTCPGNACSFNAFCKKALFQVTKVKPHLFMIKS
ncbi:MAG TPA: hypothetical protein ENK96_02430 [Desulfobulbaceae bacterium]|nr:hypothetical protein [Desulfobulbaceae bacterium]